MAWHAQAARARVWAWHWTIVQAVWSSRQHLGSHGADACKVHAAASHAAHAAVLLASFPHLYPQHEPDRVCHNDYGLMGPHWLGFAFA